MNEQQERIRIISKLVALHAATQPDQKLAIGALVEVLADIPPALLSRACGRLVYEPAGYRLVRAPEWGYCPSPEEIRRAAARLSRLDRGLRELPWTPAVGEGEIDCTHEIAAWVDPSSGQKAIGPSEAKGRSLGPGPARRLSP